MIDLIFLVVIASYAVSGYRQGLAVGALSLGGFVFGAVLAMGVVPPLAERLDPGLQRSFTVLVAVLLFAWLGQLVGALIGGRVRENLTVRPVQLLDQMFGALAGVLAVVLVLWFVGSALRVSPSQSVARAFAGSAIVNGVDAVVPDQVASLADSFRGVVAGSDFPRVFAGVAPEQIVSVPDPDPGAMSRETLRRAQRSIVKITGEAQICGRGQEGSGAVVGPQRVVTNAHVVAGMSAPRVQVGGVGPQLPALVVLFDPRRDLAVLAVPDLGAPALPLGEDMSRGDDAVVAGFPRNGAFKAGAARVRSVITATGEDIYGRPDATREVYSLFAQVEPGNSGGPVLDVRGRLAGVVFAKSLDDPNTGYALTMGASRAVIAAGIRASDQVPTGGCAVG